jgi:hypothetical protein
MRSINGNARWKTRPLPAHHNEAAVSSINGNAVRGRGDVAGAPLARVTLLKVNMRAYEVIIADYEVI